MTSSGGTEHSYLRVYRTNITNHLPEGVLESSLVQAGSLESEQPPFLQRTLGGETPGPRSSPEARTLQGERKKWVGESSFLQKTGTRESNPDAVSPGSHYQGNFKVSFMAAVIKTITEVSERQLT